MSTWLERLPPEVAQLALDAAERIARAAWDVLTGGSTAKEQADAAVAAIKRRALQALAQATADEAAAFAAGIQLGVALEVLSHAQQGVLEAMERSATSPTVPVLDPTGVIVAEQVDKI